MAVSEQDLVDFHDSLDRASNSGRFMDVFYDGFIASSIDVEKIFKDTDMGRLKRKLKSSLHMMILAILPGFMIVTVYRQKCSTSGWTC